VINDSDGHLVLQINEVVLDHIDLSIGVYA
jgi:hypothetical protein